MYGVMVSLSSETASFRDPGGQLYHSCLPLPPFSTLIGIAGAALGMNFEETFILFKNNKIYAGVKGTNNGSGRDLWNYSKVAGKNDVRKDIVNREFLVGLTTQIFYANTSSELIERIRQAFLDPFYCLSLGSSDDLTMIREVSPCLNIHSIQSSMVANTVVSGDISDQYEYDWEAIKKYSLDFNLGTPVVKQLPVEYSFTKRVRKGSRYEIFSFIPDMVKLKKPLEMYDFGECAVPMFSL